MTQEAPNREGPGDLPATGQAPALPVQAQSDTGAQSGVPQEPSSAEPPAAKVDRWAHRRAEPRPLALLWTAYLAVATLVMLTSLVMHGGADHEIYRPAARGLLAVTAVGITILWPMVRLSQAAPPEGPGAAVAKDLVVVLAPVQAIVWPQVFFVLAHWPFEVVTALSVMLISWGVLIGAVLALALHSLAASAAGPGQSMRQRAAWMGVVIGLNGVGPLVGLLSHPFAQTVSERPAMASPWALTSPVTAIFEIARDRPWSGRAAEALPAHWWAIGIVAGIGLLAWAAAMAIPNHKTDAVAPPAGDVV